MQFRIQTVAFVLMLGVASLLHAQITGVVKLEGKAPERKPVEMSAVKDCCDAHPAPLLDETVIVGKDNTLANVVVSLKKPENMEFDQPPQTPAVLSQKGCVFTPHVLAMMVGQEFTVKNEDPFLHNVHGLPIENTIFNIAQPNVNPGQKMEPLKVAETFKIKCDVHPWMLTWVRVLDNPYFATTALDGTYTIQLPGLADGKYTFVAWHEKYGEQEQTVTVKEGKAEFNFTFKAE